MQYREMKAAISKILDEGTYVEQPVPLVTLAEVTKDSGVSEIEDIMSKFVGISSYKIYILSKRLYSESTAGRAKKISLTI